MSETYTPPKSAINNAKRGLDLRKKYGRGGLTPAEAKSYGIDSGITRAKRISKGKLSRHDVRRMSAFNRHRQNYNPSKKMADGGPTAGTIAWLLWGGTSGVNWAKKQSAALGAEESFTDDEKDRVRERLIRLRKPASDSFIEGYLTAKKDLEQRKNSSKKQAESFEAESKMDKAGENFSSDWTEKSFNDGGGYDYTCMLILDIRDASKDYPLYTRIKENGGFALNPLAIIKIKEFILSGLNLNGVDYAGTTITADSIIFKFNFNNLDEAEDYFKYLNQHISRTFAKNHDEIPDNELCPHCMFSKVLIEVVDKYELGIKIANLMDWSNKEQTIDFLEYLIALENVDVEYTLNLLRERGANISKPNDYNGNSTKQLIVAEKNGYESMIEYIINELKNKKRSIDVVAFTLSADNGLKEQITNTIEQILKIDYSQLSSNLEKQLYLNQGKLAGIEDFLYYFYTDSSDFIFNNI
ncbi:MAG: hypothetical protein ACW972_00040 [Promethearchaeota archaeon]